MLTVNGIAYWILVIILCFFGILQLLKMDIFDVVVVALLVLGLIGMGKANE